MQLNDCEKNPGARPQRKAPGLHQPNNAMNNGCKKTPIVVPIYSYTGISPYALSARQKAGPGLERALKPGVLSQST
jgi:hypothetical protein